MMMKMIFENRIDIIISTLKKKKAVSNKELISILGISESTLRRDLEFLEEKGLVNRVYGGATLNRIEVEEKSYIDKEVENVDAKRIIAQKASEYLKDLKYIYLDAGTTTNYIIDYMKDYDLTVVTNGVSHLEKLIENNVDTKLLCGSIKPVTKAIYGGEAIAYLDNYNFDAAFIGANGIGRNQFTTPDINEAEVKRKVIEKSNQTYIVADSSKIGKIYFSKICNYEQAILITELSENEFNEKRRNYEKKHTK